MKPQTHSNVSLFFFLLFSFCSTVIYINSLRLFLTIISLLLQYTLVILGTSSQSQSYLKLTLAFKQSIHWPYHFSYLSHFFYFLLFFVFTCEPFHEIRFYGKRWMHDMKVLNQWLKKKKRKKNDPILQTVKNWTMCSYPIAMVNAYTLIYDCQHIWNNFRSNARKPTLPPYYGPVPTV